MGRDKSALFLGHKTLLQHVAATARTLELPVEIIFEDDLPSAGPLSGIDTAFGRFPCEAGLFLSCDMPFVSADLLRALFRRFYRTGQAVFTCENGQYGFPLVIPCRARKIVADQLEQGRRSVRQLRHALEADDLTLLSASEGELLNVNTPADYREALRIWALRQRSDAVLEVRDLFIRRGTTRLISGFSWKVRQGEHWVVLGPNGCGKTSLFAALLGYLTPTAGDVFVLGEEYGNSDWPALRKKIGLVSSSVRQVMAEAEPAWITVASGREAMIDYWGTPKARDRAEALRLLRAIEAEYLAERPWAVLSQGERQRVLIGRALMAHPALLILDEPCAGLDPAAREHFLDFLERLGRQKNAPSLVLVTHHVEEIMPVFTHALIMKAGAKLAEGPIAKTLTTSNLSTAFDTPVKLRRQSGRYSLRVQSNQQVII